MILKPVTSRNKSKGNRIELLTYHPDIQPKAKSLIQRVQFQILKFLLTKTQLKLIVKFNILRSHKNY